MGNARVTTGRRWLDATLLLGVVIIAMHGWWNGDLPLTPRREMLVQMSTAWLVRQDLAQRILFSSWTPAWFAGLPWTRFLAWPVYYVVAGFSLASGLSLEVVVKLFYLISIFGSALGLYLWASALRMGRAGAIIAGTAYALFPFHLHTAVDWWEHALFWALLPLPLWWYERHRTSTKVGWSWVIGLGGLLGILPLTNLERTLPAWTVLGLYLALREVALWRSGRRTVWQSLGLGAGAVAIAGALAAAVLLPATREMSQVAVSEMRGSRSAISADFLRGYAVSPAMIWGATLRRARLSVDTSSLPTIWKAFGGLNAWYPGVIVPLLALAGLASWRRVRGIGATWAIFAMGIIMALGPHLPYNPVLHTPFLARLMPFRGLMFASLGLALLAGAGVDWLMTWSPFRDQKALLHRPTRRSASPLRAVLFVGFLVLMLVDYKPAWAVFLHTPRYFSDDELAAYHWLEENGQGYRLWEPTGLIGNKYRYTYSVRHTSLPHFDGHWDEGVPLPMSELRHTADEPTLLNLSSVRYVLLRPDDPQFLTDSERLRDAGWSRPAWESQGAIILENRSVEPFARLYGRSLRGSGQDTAMLAAALPALTEKGVVLLDGALEANRAAPADYVWGTASAAPSGNNDAERVADPLAIPVPADSDPLPLPTWRRLRGDEIRLDVQSPRPATLVLSESWYALWRATVNDKPAPVLRANVAFLAVAVPQGHSRVVFRFSRPGYVWFGYLLSAATTLFLAAWLSYRIVS